MLTQEEFNKAAELRDSLALFAAKPEACRIIGRLLAEYSRRPPPHEIRLRQALIQIRDGYPKHHVSEMCRNIADEALR